MRAGVAVAVAVGLVGVAAAAVIAIEPASVDGAAVLVATSGVAAALPKAAKFGAGVDVADAKRVGVAAAETKPANASSSGCATAAGATKSPNSSSTARAALAAIGDGLSALGVAGAEANEPNASSASIRRSVSESPAGVATVDENAPNAVASLCARCSDADATVDGAGVAGEAKCAPNVAAAAAAVVVVVGVEDAKWPNEAKDDGVGDAALCGGIDVAGVDGVAKCVIVGIVGIVGVDGAKNCGVAGMLGDANGIVSAP